jgi:predicted dehydrogenase
MKSTPADGRPPLKIGMLGYGFMGKAHSNAFRTIPYMFWPDGARTELHAICGRTEESVRDAASRYGFSNYTTDWRELVNDASVQIFDNVGADDIHFEPTLAAIKAGKHVVCEKPLALSSEQATELDRAATAAGVKHMTCFNYRFVPAVRLAYEMIKNGDIGEIYNASFRYSQEWRTDPTADLPTKTGALSVIGCHAVDQARYLVGEIASVSAIITNPVTSAERGEPVDAVSAVAQFEAGGAGTIAASLISPGRKNMLSWEINGSKGTLTWNLEQLNILRSYRRNGSPSSGFADIIVCEEGHPLVAPWWPSGHILGWEHAHVNMLAHFLRAVADDSRVGPAAATFADGAQAARVADAMTKSAATGQRSVVETGHPTQISV